jgi:hypothetical protein
MKSTGQHWGGGDVPDEAERVCTPALRYAYGYRDGQICGRAHKIKLENHFDKKYLAGWLAGYHDERDGNPMPDGKIPREKK